MSGLFLLQYFAQFLPSSCACNGNKIVINFIFLSFSVVESLTAVTSGLLSPSSCQRRLSVSAEKVHAFVKRQMLPKSVLPRCNLQRVLAILK